MQRMHAGETAIDEVLVRRLIAAQFPQWSGLGLRRVEPSGTLGRQQAEHQAESETC